MRKKQNNSIFKIIALILVLTMVMPLSMTSCEKDKRHVAILLSDEKNLFASLIASSASAMIVSKKYYAEIFDAGGSIEAQIQQADRVFSSDEFTDVICIPVDVNSTAPITKAAAAKGIPLVYVNRYPFHELSEDQIPDNIYYVGTRDSEAGRVQALALLDERQDQEKRVIILRGEYSQAPTREWMRGLKITFGSDKNTKIVLEQNGKEDRSYSRLFVKSLIEAAETDESLRFNCILAYSDAMALGALDAVEEAGLAKQVYISGINGGSESRKAVRRGKMAVSFFQDVSRQGNAAGEVIFDLSKGNPVEQFQWIPLAKVARLKRFKREDFIGEDLEDVEVEIPLAEGEEESEDN